jgi:DNA-binding CsgD family transcriptional regulator
MASGRRGRPPHPDILTPAEWRVLEHVREGQTNAEIAVRLGITPDGVKFHVSNMLAKLNLPDRAALAAWEPPQPATQPRPWLALLAARLWGSIGLKLALGLAGAVVVDGAISAPFLAATDDGESIPDIQQSLTPKTVELEGTSFMDASIPGAPNQAQPQQTLFHEWYDADTGVRLSSVILDSGLQANTAVNVVGAYAWTSTDSVGVTATGPLPVDVNQLPYTLQSFPTRYQTPLTLADAVAKAARGGKARLAGDATVAARPAYEIEIQPGPCRPPFSTADGLETVWLDKETLIPLRLTLASADGRVVFDQQVSRVTYNEDLDPALFGPPPGARVSPLGGVPLVLQPTPANVCASANPAGVDGGFAQSQTVIDATGVAESHATVQLLPNATRVVTAVSGP